MKDFDIWNRQKKEINTGGESKFYKPRDIWWCSLGVNVGFEQDGTGSAYERPVLILRGFSKETCLVVPLTTSKKTNKYLISIGGVDGRDAQVIISQIRLIDTKRLINKVDVLDKKTFEEIRKTAKDLL